MSSIYGLALVLATILQSGPGRPPEGERELYVSVVEQDGKPVAGLGAADFVVYEDGARRDVVRVSAATIPMQVAVLVDASQELAPRLGEVRKGLGAFSRELRDRNERALFACREHARTISDYSTDPLSLERGLAALVAQSGAHASIVSSVIEVAQGLRQRGAFRPVILAVTGDPLAPDASDGAALMKLLRDADVALYVVTITASDGLPRRSLEDRLKTLALVLNNQYLVAYSPGASIAPATPRVHVKRPRVTVEAMRALRQLSPACEIVEAGASRGQLFFGYQCR